MAHTITFDRDTLDFYKKSVKRAKLKGLSFFIHKNQIVRLWDAMPLIERFEQAFEKEPEAEKVAIICE